MRIAQISPFLPAKSGGSVVYSTNLAMQLERRGHEVQFFAANFPPNGHVRFLGDHVPITTSACYGLAFGVNPVSAILPRLLDSRADVYHAHSYIFLTSNQAALAAHLRRKPFVLHIHGATYVRHASLDGRTSAALVLKEKVYDRTLGKWTIESADAIAAVSEFDLQQCRDVFGIDESRLHLLPNAVDVDCFSPRDGEAEGVPVVTYIGRLEPWKGAGTFLRVARLVHELIPDAVFRIVGSGSMYDDLVSEFRDLAGNVEFLGEVNHDLIPQVLRETTVLLLPSVIEGLPTVCLEALASGVPVVASDTGGTSEVVIDGETGYLCKPDDIDGFSDRVVKILQNDDLRRSLGERGRRLVEGSYSWTRIAEMTEHLYEQLV